MGAYLTGEMEMGVMLNVVITSLLAVFLRKGVKSDTDTDTGRAEADAGS